MQLVSLFLTMRPQPGFQSGVWPLLSSPLPPPGNIIGSGIFVSPKGVMENASSVGVALIVWIITGIITAIGALCYAELGVTIPKSGGDYSYVKDIFGGLAGWVNVKQTPTRLETTRGALQVICRCDLSHWATQMRGGSHCGGKEFFRETKHYSVCVCAVNHTLAFSLTGI